MSQISSQNRYQWIPVNPQSPLQIAEGGIQMDSATSDTQKFIKAVIGIGGKWVQNDEVVLPHPRKASLALWDEFAEQFKSSGEPRFIMLPAIDQMLQRHQDLIKIDGAMIYVKCDKTVFGL